MRVGVGNRRWDLVTGMGGSGGGGGSGNRYDSTDTCSVSPFLHLGWGGGTADGIW